MQSFKMKFLAAVILFHQLLLISGLPYGGQQFGGMMSIPITRNYDEKPGGMPEPLEEIFDNASEEVKTEDSDEWELAEFPDIIKNPPGRPEADYVSPAYSDKIVEIQKKAAEVGGHNRTIELNAVSIWPKKNNYIPNSVTRAKFLTDFIRSKLPIISLHKLVLIILLCFSVVLLKILHAINKKLLPDSMANAPQML